MVTTFDETPKWFNAEFYLAGKLAQLQLTEPTAEWTRESMVKTLGENGFSNPYDHYVAFGDGEKLSPNALFNFDEYLAAKAAQMGPTWTTEMVIKAVHDGGLTMMQHYEMFGSAEGLNPSSAFDQDKYYDAKLQQLQSTEPGKNWTLESMKGAFEAAGLTPLDHFLAYGTVEGMDKYDFSENGAPIPHPGNTKIVLTTGVDTVTPDTKDEAFKTSDKDDVINAVSSSVTSKATLNSGDVIDGGAGVDSLVVDMQSSFSGFTKGGSVKNVEQIVLDNVEGKTFDAKGVEAASSYVVNGGEKGNVIIRNVDSTRTGYAVAQEAGSFTAQIVDSALIGKTDNVTVTMNDLGTDAAQRVDVTVKGNTSGVVEGLSLIAQGKNNFVDLKVGHETVSVQGSANADIAVAAGLKTFDASSATGKITADLSAASASLKTVNGGADGDSITVGALLGAAVIDGGDGKDTLNFGSFTGTGIVKNTITDVETFGVTTTTTVAATTFDLSKVTGLETFKIGGDTGTAASGDFVLSKAADYDSLNLQLANELASVKSFAYNGEGVLNVSLEGDTAGAATGGGTTLTTLTTGNITELNLTNKADAGTLTIGSLNAVKVTNLTIDTGSEAGVTVTGTTNHLNALETVTIKGDADASFTTGAVATSLKSVDATELTGELTLDLAGATTADNKGVEVTMGTGGAASLKGTGYSDIFNLGAGSETVDLSASRSGAFDTINNFNKDDHMQLSTSGVVKTYFSAPNASFDDNTVYGFLDNQLSYDGMDDVSASGAVVSAIARDSGKTGHAVHASFETSDDLFFAIDNGDYIGFYLLKTNATIASGTALTSANINSVTLISIIEPVDGVGFTDFVSANFA